MAPTPNFAEQLASHILQELNVSVANETIQLCGLDKLQILASRPQQVLQIAKDRLHSWPYHNVPVCWRRLYEDASLHIAAALLKKQSSHQEQNLENLAKRRKIQDKHDSDGWLTEVVKILDGAVIVSGAPGRKGLIEGIFMELDRVVAVQWRDVQRQHLHIKRPRALQTEHSILRVSETYDVEAFQLHLDMTAAPIIIPRTFEHWPARKLWSDITYLKIRTIGGNRLVPVEIGSSYTEDSWSQKLMRFGDFIEQYLASQTSAETGYLAQHDLFTQIPSLKNDISTPDFCFTVPPAATGAAAQTAGVNETIQLTDPLVNAWLGPAGTKTPLHTDAYHNILCQVVGYKFVRLYAPEETPRVYPDGVDASGINMSNTSQVDIRLVRPRLWDGEVADEAAIRDIATRFPKFGEAKYQEAILGPGDCLYIPLGYWHYVESLTASFSVSFWWN